MTMNASAASAARAADVADAATTLVLSFDDGPNLKQTALLSVDERHQALLDALAAHAVTAVLFVTVNFGADRPHGLALARAWGEAGHRIGNHTVTHLDLDDANVSLAQYQQEVLECDAVIRQLPGYRKWFRYTYLHEGVAVGKREGMRAFLQQHGYVNSPITLDTADWQLDLQLEAALRQDPLAELVPFRETYLNQFLQRAQASRERGAKPEPGREGLAQMVLLHHNLSNALWLRDAMALLKQRGWRFGLPESAFAQR